MATDFLAVARAARGSSRGPVDRKRLLSLIAYWRASLISRSYSAVRPPTDYDPLAQGLRKENEDRDSAYWQTLTEEGFRTGRAPQPFVKACFARIDARIAAANERRKAKRPPLPPLPYPAFFFAELSPFAVVARSAGRVPVREMPAFASVAVGRAGDLLPAVDELSGGVPPTTWLVRRYFAESTYGARSVRFGPFADYLDYVGDVGRLVREWPDLIGFFDGCWMVATGNAWGEWSEAVRDAGLTIASGWIREGVSDAASMALVRQLDDLREWVALGNRAPAFETFCAGSGGRIYDREVDRTLFMLGHVGGKPLASSQRACASTFVSMRDGDVQAVNGPPGTGKTTLLRSVLADMVVRSALKGGSPPVVVATAATNQAVTNMLDAFAKGVRDERLAFGVFGERWIEGLESYGAYVRASSRKPRDDWDQQVVVFDPIGDFGALSETDRPSETRLESARSAMRQTAGGGEFSFRHLILRAMWDGQDAYWAERSGEALGGEYRDLRKGMGRLRELLASYASAIEDAEGAIRAFEDALPQIGPDGVAEAKASLAKGVYATVYGRDPSRLDVFRRLEAAAADGDGDFAQTMRGVVDLGLRRYAFQIAARWWEGEFLRRVRAMRTRRDRIEEWRLAACVTPCFVATFDRLATAFTRWRYGQAKTMWGEADLLVVDEAGQAGPDRGAGAFGIAPRALVVGDVLQLPPVEGEDAPMYGPAIAKREGVLDEDAIERGLLVGIVPEGAGAMVYGRPETGEGSVMRGAAYASHVHFEDPAGDGPDRLGRGAWLLDHYRCRPGIIAYSNAGWYKNRLVPRKEKGPFPYPEFGLIDVRDDALSSSSRRNAVEARAAADFLARERKRILEATGAASLEQAVAVITPFRDQASAARKALRDALGREGGRIVCGTVHSLQGAERPLVLFLTAYGGAYFANDTPKAYFFDRQGTLLNVAASRAQESFIVVGDKRVFEHARSGTPTGALAGLLTRVR